MPDATRFIRRAQIADVDAVQRTSEVAYVPAYEAVMGFPYHFSPK